MNELHNIVTWCRVAVANVALRKESFVSNKRQFKRHVRNQWTHGQAARAVDGDTDSTLHSCTLLDNFYVEKPVWMVDLGTKVKVSGVVIVTWQGRVEGHVSSIKRPQSTRSTNTSEFDFESTFINTISTISV